MFEFLQGLFFVLCWLLCSLLLAPFTARMFLSRDRFKFLAKVNADHVAESIAEAIRPYAETVFPILEMHYRKTSRTRSCLRVLEIGVGTGVNFAYYPQGTQVICVDINPYYSQYFLESLNRNPHVQLERTLTTSAEDVHEIPDGIVDCVVSTYTLCAVDNVDAVLQEVKRVLKPGGCMLFVEPVSDPKNIWNSFLRKIASPLFILYLGYHINRQLERNLISADFAKLEYEHIHLNWFNQCFNTHIAGIAIK